MITQAEARRIAQSLLSELHRSVTEVIEHEGHWECHWDSTGCQAGDREGIPIRNPILISKQDGALILIGRTTRVPRSSIVENDDPELADAIRDAVEWFLEPIPATDDEYERMERAIEMARGVWHS